jgi:hypothetical protein
MCTYALSDDSIHVGQNFPVVGILNCKSEVSYRKFGSVLNSNSAKVQHISATHGDGKQSTEVEW